MPGFFCPVASFKCPLFGRCQVNYIFVLNMDAKEKRYTCAHCGKKRNESYLQTVFVHPVLCPAPVRVCADTWNVKCKGETMATIMLYHNTGLIELTPVKDLNNNQTPGARTGKPKREKK